MPSVIRLGEARSKPGTIQYGRWEAFTHPTGLVEFLPVVIAQGVEPGPCIWLTAGIHGDEHTGPAVLYELINQELVAQLRGTIVAIPALSPVSLRTQVYVPHHERVNPNRLWPDGKETPRENDPEKRPPTALERAYQRLFAEIKKTADFLIDYHNTWQDSIPFAFRDRVLYKKVEDPQKEKASRAETLALAQRLADMLEAFGHTIVNEFPAEKYIKEHLHRSTSGAALLVARIPAFTVELSSGLQPKPAVVQAAAAGTRNVLRWAGMLPGEPEPITGIQVVKPPFPVRRTRSLTVEAPCIALPLVMEGDMVTAGQPLARLVDAWGRELPQSPLCARADGFVMGRAEGIYFYPGETVIYMAIKDDADLVGHYPEEYYSSKTED